MEARQVVIKDLASGSQETVPRAGLEASLRAQLGGELNREIPSR